MQSSFAVKIGEFEGPLDLLLSLIEEKKMLISDVSLSRVADDFLRYMEAQSEFPLRQAAHFVLIAATLLLLKSKSLLPVLTLTDDEEGDIKDLEFRLALYQVYRNIALKLGRLSKHMYIGDGARITEPLFTPSKDLSVASLLEAGKRALKEAPQFTLNPEVTVKNIISLEEMIDKLSNRIEKAISMTFREFSGTEQGNKYELVVSFLAMLELVKRGLMIADQGATLGEISMKYSGSLKAPRYE